MAATAPKCPYLAINIPGERPFVVERKLYDSAIRDRIILDTTLTKCAVKEHGEIWVLTITHKSGRALSRARGTLRFYNQLQTRFKTLYQYTKFKEGLADWAARAHQNRQAVAASPHQKQIKRLEKELSRLYARKPISPLLREEAVQFYRSTGTACIAHSHDDDRVYALRWRNERSQRMQLALIGGWAVKNIITPAKAYELLSEAGYSVKKFGSLTKNTRRYYGISSDSDYWRKLYLIEYGLAPKRRASYVETPLTEQLTAHRESLIQFLVHKREIDSIKTQIESIKALAADIVPAANETGVVYA